jgi:3-hydroxybutyrate dehydrogenase
VGSPLFTEHAEASAFLDLEKDYLLPPDEIAKAMISLITEDKYKPGTVLEICEVGNWREVSLLNDPGPSGPASKTSKKHEAIQEIMKYLGEGSNGTAQLNKVVKTD